MTWRSYKFRRVISKLDFATKNIYRSFLLLHLLGLLCSPLSAQMKHLSLRRYKIDNVSLVNLSTYSVAAHLQVRNDTTAFSLSNISGQIYRKGKPFASWSTGDICLNSGINDVYIKGICTIRSGVSIFTLIRTILHLEPSLFSLDVELFIYFPSGDKKYLSRQRVQLSKLKHHIF
jgi:hypothetical protein